MPVLKIYNCASSNTCQLIRYNNLKSVCLFIRAVNQFRVLNIVIINLINEESSYNNDNNFQIKLN